MKIELKNIKVMDSLSEETICFSATIHVDGKKVGTAKNQGRGGPTDIDIPNQKFAREFDAYTKSLPSLPCEAYENSELEEMPLPMDSELFINMLVAEWLKNKDEKKMAKKIERLDKKYKQKFEEQGFRTIRAELSSNKVLWTPTKCDDDQSLKAVISSIEVKNSTHVTSWKIL